MIPNASHRSLRSLKIRLNDSAWSSNEARAKGLRRLAVAQLGSAGILDETEFRRRLVDNALGSTVPRALRIAASVQRDPKHKAALIEAAVRCERERSREAAKDARVTASASAAAAAAAAAAAYAYAARDKSLADYAEDVVQILIEMKAPGCQWLPLTET